MTATDTVQDTVRAFLETQGIATEVTLETALFSEGVGLDSLQTAELSVLLEDELGSDPFSAGLMPQRVQEIADFYSK